MSTAVDASAGSVGWQARHTVARMSDLDDDLDVQPVSGALGALVHGVDLSAMHDDQVGVLWDLLLTHKVLFLPEQHLDREEHVALGRRFGALETFHPAAGDGMVDQDATHPEVLALRSEQGLIADLWHTDVTWSASPPVASVVRMVQTPEWGGDTMWSNQALAFRSLTAPMREMLLGLSARHSGYVIGHPEHKATHPVVRSHPETGEPCLFVNRQFTRHIEELAPGESDALLQYLFGWCEQPQFTCRHHWSAGTVAIWDNRCTMHYVVNDFTDLRHLERVTVMGDSPEPAGDLRWPTFRVEGISASAGPALMRS